MKPVLLIVLTVVVTALLLLTRPDSKAELQPLPPTRVLTGEVRQMDIRPVARMKGKLQPARKITLHMEVSGNVTERAVEPGQQVEAGEFLLAVANGDFEDAVVQARALLRQEQDAVERDMALLALMKEKYAIQQREVQRMEKLGQESLASKSNYDSALRALLQLQEEQTRLQFSVNTAQSRLATRRSELNLAERNLERSRLNAPFAATVNAVAVDIGDYIAAGQVALELVQIDTLDLYLEITGELARVLELGQEIPVVVSGTTYVGRIHALAPDPAPLTHTHALRIRVTGTSLFPGQLAEAALPGEISRDVTVVPVSAVLREEGEAYVFSVTGETLQRLPVNPLARQDDMQVIDGVPAGTKIVIKDVGLLADGQKVHVQ